jgi:hypothetical protein
MPIGRVPNAIIASTIRPSRAQLALVRIPTDAFIVRIVRIIGSDSYTAVAGTVKGKRIVHSMNADGCCKSRYCQSEL